MSTWIPPDDLYCLPSEIPIVTHFPSITSLWTSPSSPDTFPDDLSDVHRETRTLLSFTSHRPKPSSGIPILQFQIDRNHKHPHFHLYHGFFSVDADTGDPLLRYCTLRLYTPQSRDVGKREILSLSSWFFSQLLPPSPSPSSPQSPQPLQLRADASPRPAKIPTLASRVFPSPRPLVAAPHPPAAPAAPTPATPFQWPIHLLPEIHRYGISSLINDSNTSRTPMHQQDGVPCPCILQAYRKGTLHGYIDELNVTEGPGLLSRDTLLHNVGVAATRTLAIIHSHGLHHNSFSLHNLWNCGHDTPHLVEVHTIVAAGTPRILQDTPEGERDPMTRHQMEVLPPKDGDPPLAGPSTWHQDLYSLGLLLFQCKRDAKKSPPCIPSHAPSILKPLYLSGIPPPLRLTTAEVVQHNSAALTEGNRLTDKEVKWIRSLWNAMDTAVRAISLGPSSLPLRPVAPSLAAATPSLAAVAPSPDTPPTPETTAAIPLQPPLPFGEPLCSLLRGHSDLVEGLLHPWPHKRWTLEEVVIAAAATNRDQHT